MGNGWLLTVVVLAASALAAGCDLRVRAHNSRRRQPPPCRRSRSATPSSRDRRMGRVHGPLRCRRDRGGACARLRPPHRGALQGRAGRQAGRPAVRDRPASLRARAGAGPGRAARRPPPGSRTPTSTSTRGRPLLERAVISKKTFDDRENLVRDAQAAVKVAEAKVKTAELELSFSRITSPHLWPHQPHAGDAPATG